MGFHKRGDEESNAQEGSCGKTIYASGSAPVCQLEIEIERELESHDTERERRRAAQSRVHMQFVCGMYKLQHEEGRYFLHEHRQSELRWRKECAEEIQEITGAKLMSVNQGSCSLSSIRRERNVELNEKPTMMVTNCPAIAFTLNKRYTKHLERSEHCQSEHKNVEDLRGDISCGIQLQHKWTRQHKYLLAIVDVKNSQANFNDLENSVSPEESNDELLDQAWDDHTGASLDAKKVKEARQLGMEYYDKMHVFAYCSMLGEDRQGTPESKMG